MRKLLLTIWLSTCVVVLALALYLNGGDPTAKEIGPIFFWYMIFLSFPSGLLVAGTGALFSATAGGDINVSATPLFLVTWVAFVAVGYFQWFVFLPYLKRKLGGATSTSSGRLQD